MRFRWWRRDGKDADGRPEQAAHGASSARLRYHAFQHILYTNNRALELLARIETLSDQGGVTLPEARSLVRDLVRMTSDLVQSLNVMTGGREGKLMETARRICQPIMEALAEPLFRPDAPLVLDLDQVSYRQVTLAGNKATALAEAARVLPEGLRVPPGFVLTVRAEKIFLESNNLESSIDEMLSGVKDPNDPRLADLCEKIRQMILQATVPQELRSAWVAAVERLAARWKEIRFLAVRSSAVGEDSTLSFAGQFDTVLNVPLMRLESAYKTVLASKYSARCLCYLMDHGLAREDVPMGVLCLPMLNPRASGVLYTADPNRVRDRTMIVSATFGLGEPVVSGRARTDLYRLPWHGDLRGSGEIIAEKKTALRPDPEGGVIETAVPPERASQPCLTEQDLRRLRELGVTLANHFRGPQDVEWAVDEEGTLFLLQTRPLVLFHSPEERVQILPPDYPTPVLRDGFPASAGVASGAVFFHSGNPRKNKPPRGSVLVVQRAEIDYAVLLPRIAALVAEAGNPAGHLATLLRERAIPSVMQARDATKLLAPGETVTVDGYRGTILRGDHSAKLASQPSPHPVPFFDPGRAWLASVRNAIVPLNLTSLLSLAFVPSACRTVHDVIRYVHEMSMRAMFESADTLQRSRETPIYTLECPLPVRIRVIDLGENAPRPANRKRPVLQPQELRSRPFQALYRGMTRPGVRWSGPVPLSARGFAAVLATAAADAGATSRILGGDSYLLVSEKYLNLNVRLAYHFCMVDAYIVDNAKENYINFRFKGGGASLERRRRRIRMVEGVLSASGFTVVVEQDLLNAWLKERDRNEMEEALAMLGSLMGWTRQMDMAMESEAQMESLKQTFLKFNSNMEAG